jgi:hypothetical protein
VRRPTNQLDIDSRAVQSGADQASNRAGAIDRDPHDLHSPERRIMRYR